MVWETKMATNLVKAWAIDEIIPLLKKKLKPTAINPFSSQKKDKSPNSNRCRMERIWRIPMKWPKLSVLA